MNFESFFGCDFMELFKNPVRSSCLPFSRFAFDFCGLVCVFGIESSACVHGGTFLACCLEP